MKLSIFAGSTSQSVNIFVRDSSSTTGEGLVGLAFDTASLTAYYTFSGVYATATAFSLATLAAVNSAYSSGGFKELDSTHMPGCYRLDIPDAALAVSKGRSVVVLLRGATNMAPLLIEIELTATNNQLASFGLSLAKTTNITGLNDIAATAIVSSGSITTSGGAVTTVANLTNAPTNGDLTATMKASVTAAASSSTPAVTVSDKTGFSLSSGGVAAIWDALTSALNISGSIGKRIVDYLTGDSYVRLGAPAGASVSADVAAVNAKTTNLPPAPAAVGNIPTANQNADALLDRSDGVETSVTPRGALRAILAALAGVATGGNSTTITLKNPAGTVTRITLTVDEDGNRSSSTLNV